MNFDFYQQYKDYSNIDLLKIVKRPDDYQPAAVAVAIQLLAERQVEEEEIQWVEEYYQNKETATAFRKEKIDGIKNKATDFFEPVLYPSERVQPRKWVNILLLVIGLRYAWSLLKTGKSSIGFMQCEYCTWDVFYMTSLLTLFYVPLIFYLVFQKRRWGWILLFADNLFSLISLLGQSYLFFKYQNIHHGEASVFFTSVFIKGVFVFFLSRDVITNYFGVNQETKQKTAFITTVATVCFILLMYWLY